MDILTLLLSGISILGALLVARKRISGFYIWLFTNTAWIVVDVWYGLLEQIPIWVAYTASSAYSIYYWRKK